MGRTTTPPEGEPTGADSASDDTSADSFDQAQTDAIAAAQGVAAPEPIPGRGLTPDARRRALSACVTRMRSLGLTGKARDDAAGHFLAGIAAVCGGPIIEGWDGRYVDVLEALAD